MAGHEEWLGLTDQGCDGRGEDRAALHHEGHPSTHHHGEVAGEPAERVWEVCQGMGTNRDMATATSGLGARASQGRVRGCQVEMGMGGPWVACGLHPTHQC